MNPRGYETIYQLLRGWAKDTPEAIAFVAPAHEPISYRQLLEQLDSTIKSLREIGIGRNDRIAIVLPNGIEMAGLLLGVSCAAISVPLNPLYRENEFESYLRDIGAKALVVQSGAHSPAVLVAQRHGIPVIELVSSPNAASGLFTLKASAPISSVPQHTLEPDNVALILHTSGTTARPKRVPLTHRNLCASAFSVRDALNFTSGDRCLGAVPLFHIHGLIGGLLSSLAAGASFASTPDFEGDCFFDWMKELTPTWYTADRCRRSDLTVWHAALSEEREGKRLKVESLMNTESLPMTPYRMLKEIRDFLPRDAICILDGNVFMAAAQQVLPTYLPASRLTAGSNGCLGVGIPFGIGAKLAHPGRCVIVICGDTAFGFNAMDMETAVRHGVAVIVVVVNNDGNCGALMQKALFSTGAERVTMYQPGIQYENIMRAFGGHAEFVDRPEQLRPALTRATASGKAACVNVQVDPNTPYPRD